MPVLNTLFVATDGAWVHKDHESIVVRVDRQEKLRVPTLHVGSVICFGRVSVSPELMADLAERSIHLAWLSDTGRMQARVEGIPGGNVLLRRVQFRTADLPEASLALARAFVIGKVANERLVLQHAARDADEPRRAVLADRQESLAHHLRAIARVSDIDSLRGLEGIAAKDYYAGFPSLLKTKDDAFAFAGRSRRPPRDRINALLSFGYALLMQDCVGACVAIGLDPAVGFLHEDRPGRLALALDLMEEFRAPVVDRLVFTLINRLQIRAKDVIEAEPSCFRLTESGRRAFLVEYQRHKAEVIHHRFMNERFAWGRIPHVQAVLLARTLRGDLDAYPPFVIR